MHYSTFLIDLDHTLFDSDASELAAFTQAMNLAGVAELDGHASAFRRINLELWAAVERGETSPQQVRLRRFERLVEEAGLDADASAMAEAYVLGLAANGELYAGARDILETLSRHASLALLTNGLSDVQRARIERVCILHYFDAVIISAEVGTAKPAREIFDIAFGLLDSPRKETALMVGTICRPISGVDRTTASRPAGITPGDCRPVPMIASTMRSPRSGSCCTTSTRRRRSGPWPRMGRLRTEPRCPGDCQTIYNSSVMNRLNGSSR